MTTCARCDGCGQIANSAGGEPWSAWLDLPLRSATAVLVGAVRPLPCPTCSITCPRCGRTSWNPNDVLERYCGACHRYHPASGDRLLER